MSESVMVYAEMMGNVFEIDLHAPRDHARAWAGYGWREHFLTNEEVLFNDGAYYLEPNVTKGLQAFERQATAA